MTEMSFVICFVKQVKIYTKGSIYTENNIGPNTGPLGTPQNKGAADDENSPRLTEKLLSNMIETIKIKYKCILLT